MSFNQCPVVIEQQSIVGLVVLALLYNTWWATSSSSEFVLASWAKYNDTAKALHVPGPQVRCCPGSG